MSFVVMGMEMPKPSLKRKEMNADALLAQDVVLPVFPV